MNYKSVYIKGKWLSVQKGGLLGKKEETDFSRIDGNQLAEQIESACNEFARNGFKVISITPVSSGSSDYIQGLNRVFTPTTGAIVTAERIEQSP
ncbi:hypothetical protein Mal4_48410 [Maioricimonas rarisocia]|uniref:DUF4177 domain-containing protein n=1 Tax=Maioricimonas rarisocia TaxID=2528026 RepID=A0A517ZDC3_9PLAN|nr:hypothetical protein [Maioricimonas rarisocia]QDU40484.1 hypothetical protein Mal4_48410 [Maioricimonas rarisocia]